MNEALEVKPSSIPSAGEGLFTRKRIAKGSLVCEYKGRQLRTAEAIRLTDKTYLMRLGPQVYVDARDHEEVQARYINDCRNAFLYNVIFAKIPEERLARVIAIKDIEPGQEIFADYGRWYWLASKPVTLSEEIRISASSMQAPSQD